MGEYTGANHGAFGVEGAKYSVRKSGTWGTPKELKNVKTFVTNFEGGQTPIYSDNMLKVTLRSDNGFKGSIGVTAQNLDFEKDLGYVLDGENGAMAVSGTGYIDTALYVEIPIVLSSGKQTIVKRWYYNCEIEKGSATHNTTTNTPNPADYTYPLTVKGETVLDEDGVAEYIDENGNRQKAFFLQATPADSNYSTFGDAVPEVIIKTT